MNIGFVGLGKLGLPVAVCVDLLGHDVMGTDVRQERMNKRPKKEQEKGLGEQGKRFNDYLETSDLEFGDLQQVCEHSSGGLLFVAVQTPHDPKYEGRTPAPEDKRDFDYSHIEGCVRGIVSTGVTDLTVVVISTMLPGTMDREILPLVPDCMQVVYNPFFIAMGTVMQDFMNPEFVLLGVRDLSGTEKIESFYDSVTDAPLKMMSIASAEATKVMYNTYITMKICYSSMVMEMCDRVQNADCGDVLDAICSAGKRLTSSMYLQAGMPDGGSCHPRDNIAMSFLAEREGMSCNMYDDIIRWREAQTRYLAKRLVDVSMESQLPICVLGKAFKAETNIETGSPSHLMMHYIEKQDVPYTSWDPHIDDRPFPFDSAPAVFFIATKHVAFYDIVDRMVFGSVVLDPWGMFGEWDHRGGVTYRPIGREIGMV
jgi:UDPglucose 6-dehydrogenase